MGGVQLEVCGAFKYKIVELKLFLTGVFTTQKARKSRKPFLTNAFEKNNYNPEP